MARLVNQFATATLTLGADVADAGTFTLSYPSGTSQKSFLAGQAASGSYMIVNNNDRYAVGAGGIAIAYGASLITITNNTGATLTAGTGVLLMFERMDGFDRKIITFPIPALSALTNADIVTNIQPGVEGTIEYMEFVTFAPVTTAAKTATIKAAVNGTAVTGGDLVVTSALATPMGKVISSAFPTAGNVLTRESTLSLTASSVTAFVEGSGSILVYVRPTYDNQY